MSYTNSASCPLCSSEGRRSRCVCGGVVGLDGDGGSSELSERTGQALRCAYTPRRGSAPPARAGPLMNRRRADDGLRLLPAWWSCNGQQAARGVQFRNVVRNICVILQCSRRRFDPRLCVRADAGIIQQAVCACVLKSIRSAGRIMNGWGGLSVLAWAASDQRPERRPHHHDASDLSTRV